ncbi:Protein of unknown function [Pyronema omphalodes CBS 100304]|uniref:Uncharacterized protein n=1 Tax=Pyronema omphalodes (strain CBS 100304) TaxID=1076935 RepID=U4LWG0_PYROM|nr:Protein of unknown function [Pyronema omphalodes CBS 100304]
MDRWTDITDDSAVICANDNSKSGLGGLGLAINAVWAVHQYTPITIVLAKLNLFLGITDGKEEFLIFNLEAHW